MPGRGTPSRLGMWGVPSWVKTDEKYFAKMFTLSFESV